mgnify:CR=1 FL=1
MVPNDHIEQLKLNGGACVHSKIQSVACMNYRLQT